MESAALTWLARQLAWEARLSELRRADGDAGTEAEAAYNAARAA
jgi:hypothetical protein